jgi:hypothetical protein
MIFLPFTTYYYEYGMGGECSRHGTFQNFIGKPERNRTLAALKRGWEDNIKMDLKIFGQTLSTGSR